MDALGLTSIYLDKLSNYCLKHFVNVIPCDYLPKYSLEPNMQFIINLSDSNTPGSHFVAISCHDNYITYFDSFGLECTNSWILSHLKNHSIIQSNTQIQSLSSMFCGFFCLSFLIEDEKGKSIEEYLNLYQDDLTKNDDLCVSIIKKHILTI